MLYFHWDGRHLPHGAVTSRVAMLLGPGLMHDDDASFGRDTMPKKSRPAAGTGIDRDDGQANEAYKKVYEKQA